MKKRLATISGVTLTLICAGFFAFALAYSSPGKASGYVNDFANILDAGTKTTLEQKLVGFETKTSHEVTVVTIPSLDGDYIENYAEKLFKEWGIGKKDVDNGILFLVAPNDREVRIEVGYGLEGALVDSEANTIIQDYVLPEFKADNYAGGIVAGVDGIITATEGEIVSTNSSSSSSMSVNWGEIFFFVIFAFFWAMNIIVQILASSKSWWLGGVLGGSAGLLMTFFGFFGVTLTFGLIVSAILAALGLLIDYFVSKNSESILKKFGRDSNGTWIGGGGFGGGSSSGGSFGGFGGGGSGGGGSSGSW